MIARNQGTSRVLLQIHNGERELGETDSFSHFCPDRHEHMNSAYDDPLPFPSDRFGGPSRPYTQEIDRYWSALARILDDDGKLNRRPNVDFSKKIGTEERLELLKITGVCGAVLSVCLCVCLSLSLSLSVSVGCVHCCGCGFGVLLCLVVCLVAVSVCPLPLDQHVWCD